MSAFIGEYECRLDTKGRIMVPAGLRKQLAPEAKETFVINRGFEQHLTLYPMNEWEKVSAGLGKLNLWVPKNRKFYRQFHNGATQVTLDGNGRLLLPKTLMDYAKIDKDVLLFAYAGRIEAWAPDIYKKYITEDADSFSTLAEEVMGKAQDGNDGVS